MQLRQQCQDLHSTWESIKTTKLFAREL